MEYDKLGRRLGIYTRVAAKIFRDRRRQGAFAARPTPARVAVRDYAREQPRRTVQSGKMPDPRRVTRNVTRNVARGGRGFGRGFWKSFSRAGRALWHEVTGVFFVIFMLFFAQNLWRVRDAWRSGPEHDHFVIYLLGTLVFAYFSVTAFVTSRRPRR